MSQWKGFLFKNTPFAPPPPARQSPLQTRSAAQPSPAYPEVHDSASRSSCPTGTYMAIRCLRGRWQLSSHHVARNSKYLMIISCPRARTFSDKEKGTLKVIKVLSPVFYSGLPLAAPPGSHSSSSREELPTCQLHCWMALNRVLPRTRGWLP